MDTIKKFAMGKAGIFVMGLLAGTVAGGLVRKLPLANKLPTYNG